MFFFLFSLLSSSLQRGDDPYKILGLDKTATKDQIKANYRKLTYKFHPDISKDESTTKDWIRVNEAYELLSDPSKKACFDQYGSFECYDHETADSMSSDPSSYRFFQSNDVEIDTKNIQKITVVNFEEYTKNDGEYMFAIYSSVTCPECNPFLDWFDMFRNEQYKILKCGCIDTFLSADLATNIGAKTMPSLVYMKKHNGKTKISISTEKIASYKDIVDFFISQYKSNVYYVMNADQLKSVISKYPSNSIVIQFVRNNGTVNFMRMASKYEGKYTFVVFITKDYREARAFNIKSFPAILMFRHPALPPLQVKAKHLDEVLNEYQMPLFWEVDSYNWNMYCKESCILRCGYPDGEISSETVTANLSLGIIEPGSKMANELRIYPHDLAFVSREDGIAIKIKRTGDDFDSIKHFKENPELKNQIRIPPNFGPSFSFASLKESIMRRLNLSQFSIPQPFKSIGTFILIRLVLRFINGKPQEAPQNNQQNGENNQKNDGNKQKNGENENGEEEEEAETN